MQLGEQQLGEGWEGLAYGPTGGFADALEIRSWAAGLGGTADPISMQSLLYDTYLAVGSTDLTGKLYDLKRSGFWQKVKDYAIPGSRRTIKVHQGAEGPAYTFNVLWMTDRLAASNFLQALAQIDDDGTKFYPRDSLWYYKLYLADSAPDPLNQTWIWTSDIKVYLKEPYLYSEINQMWEVVAGTLPQTSPSMDNYGHLPDGFESIAVTGHWSSPNHVEDLVLSVAGGDNMTLLDHLLSDEKITLGVDGSLATEWTASITSLATFQRDATTSGATFSGDHIAIAANGYATITLAGPWPTKRAIKMTADLVVSSGSSVQVSTDGGTTFSTALSGSDITNWYPLVYYLAGTAKAADIQIKFNCPAGQTFHIYSLKIERELDCSGADLPHVDAGAQATFTVSCDVTKSTSATIAATYHPRRMPI